MNDFDLLKAWIITASVGTSAVRNQGNGIAQPIRDKLIAIMKLDRLMDALRHRDPQHFIDYLNELTEAIDKLKGISKNGKLPGRVRWGTARKCVNLTLRAVVYNAFIGQKYGIKKADFKVGGIMSRLELPLDRYVVKGIKKDCKEFNIEFDRSAFRHFSIIDLDRKESRYYQEKACLIEKERNICKIHLDMMYWRELGKREESAD